MEKVYLGIPCYGNSVNEGHLNATSMASKKQQLQIIETGSMSILTFNFNRLYAHALNARKQGITHFCMLHDDIVPEAFWLEKMLELMAKHGADILSVVSPIKDNHGLTSTALDEPMAENIPQQWRVRRLTLHEVWNDYPGTFTADNLLVNTGCMLVDIRKDWADKLHFRFENAIIPSPRDPSKLEAVCMPEDWLFSRDARKLGAKIFATREIKIYHEGKARFGNHAWGSLKRDQIDPVK